MSTARIPSRGCLSFFSFLSHAKERNTRGKFEFCLRPKLDPLRVEAG